MALGLGRVVLLAGGLAAISGVPAACANDSTGYLGTGGIELTASRDIRMLSEDLRVSRDTIEVAYVFRNESQEAVDTLVVFPFPDVDLSPGLTASAWFFPREDDDFLGFRAWVDGEPVDTRLERRAVFEGRDVTDAVAAAGAFALAPWRPGAYDGIAKTLPPAGLDRLRKQGLIKAGEDEDNPQWTLRYRYYWRQTFPAGRDVRVRHAYTPFLGSGIVADAARIDGRTAIGRPIGDGDRPEANRYCLDDVTKRRLVEHQAEHGGAGSAYDAYDLTYILTTARNWAGPIGRFHLTLDAGAPENQVALCWDGLVKTGPATYELTRTDFVPDRELRVLFLVRIAAP